MKTSCIRDMLHKKKIIISVSIIFIILIVSNNYFIYNYNNVYKNISPDCFYGTYQFEHSSNYLSIMNDNDKKEYYIYDKNENCIETGTYEKVDANCLSFNTAANSSATLVYSYHKFYYTGNGQDVTIMNKVSDSPIYYENH